MTMETKLDIIKKYEEGTRNVALTMAYSRNQSTIGTIIKNKEAIKASKSSKGTTVLASGRTPIKDEMERLLLLLIKEKEIDGDALTQSVISHKASAIFADLLEAQRDSRDEGMLQQATPHLPPTPSSRLLMGGLIAFRRRTGVHSVIRHGEVTSSDMKAADEFLKKQLISREAYIPQQVFNFDETGFFWNKIPRRTYITPEEKKLPGHKPMKADLPSHFVHHSENPRTFKA
ncbi:tigger transposable element-derived protein 1-like [Palaemon carinicauda]|uniref:tigger transposable element-derived protein 1-like n=1 Tax=Palaemon carinicauda TaxID=392227 RepID=UPI0035B5E6DF